MFGRTYVEVEHSLIHGYLFYLWKGCTIIDGGDNFKSFQDAAEAGVKAQKDYKKAQKILKGRA